MAVGLEPPAQKLCDVDTSKFKKEPQGGRYKIAFAAQGPTNSWALENEEAFKYHAKERKADVLYASANGDATPLATICWHQKHAWPAFCWSHRARFPRSIGLPSVVYSPAMAEMSA